MFWCVHGKEVGVETFFFSFYLKCMLWGLVYGVVDSNEKERLMF